MAIMTISDPVNLASNGTVTVKVAAGIAHVGENIEMTPAEVTALSPILTLLPGVAAVTPKSAYRKPDASIPRANRT